MPGPFGAAGGESISNAAALDANRKKIRSPPEQAGLTCQSLTLSH